MIPKIIHYCWFGRGEKPELAKKCIASWRKFCPVFPQSPRMIKSFFESKKVSIIR